MRKTPLGQARPELADQLVDQSLRDQLGVASTKKVEWRCERGHTWFATVSNRVNRNSGCPYCAGKLPIPGENDLATTHPDLAQQLTDPTLAKQLTAGSNKKVGWRCENGHTWDAPVYSRISGANCPYCSNRRTLPGFNDLATTHPDIAEQLVDQNLASKLTEGSSKRVEWRCEHGHTWLTTPRKRTLGQNCPYCSGKKTLAGFNDIQTTNPRVAARLENQDLGTSHAQFSNKRATWVCPDCGTSFQATFAQMSLGKAACPNCAQRKAHPGRTDLATTHPKLADELKDKTLATKLTSGSNKKVTWVCHTCGNEWSAKVLSRTYMGSGCPYCAGKKTKSGMNDIATTHPHIAKELVDQTLATQLTKGSHQVVEWRCGTCGKTWSCAVFERCTPHGGTGCPHCASTGPSKGEKELSKLVKELIMDEVVHENDRKALDGLELDIYIPALGTAFEFNGIYWHNEEHRPKNYHLEKRKTCESKGIRLIQIWQDDWELRRIPAMRLVAAKLGKTERLREIEPLLDKRMFEHIGARELTARTLEPREARAFLETNHIQGACSASLHVGLVDDAQTIRACMSIRSPEQARREHREKDVWEIRRYATYGTIPGGFSKLLSFAEAELARRGRDLRKWLSFASCDISDGHLYETCGFTLESEMPPDYSYIDTKHDSRKRIPKERFQKNRFERDPNLRYQNGWTESEAATANGLIRVWDSGKLRYEKTKD